MKATAGDARHANGELSGEIAVVTGGSRGIGRAIARALADADATVAVVARNVEGAERAADELPGEGHRGYACDVADTSLVQERFDEIADDLDPPSILVNNAGITRDNLLLRLKEDDWDEVVDVNLKGAYNATRAVTKGMMKARRGVVLNVTSVVGLMGNAGQSNYAASKAGLIGFTKSVARELASRGIRCNAIAPGYVTTDMTAELGEHVVETLRERILLGRLGDPEDIADVARFLCGPWARYITGQVLAVDGGMAL